MKKSFLYIALIMILFFSPGSGFCQTGKGGVRGVVKGMIIRHGKIVYVRLPNIKASLEFTGYSSSTGEDGRFEIINVPEGSYTLVMDDGKGNRETKNVIIKTGRMLNAGQIPILLPQNSPTPSVEKGSIIAAFSSKKDTRIYKRDAPMLKEGDTSTNSLVVYKPDTGRVYLEVVLKDRPALITCGRKSGEVFVATEKQNLEFWNLNEPEMVKLFRLPGAVSHLAWNEDKSRLFVSIFTDEKSGIIIINAEKNEIEDMIIPPPMGIISSLLPIGNGSSIYALLAREGDGRLILLERKNGKYIIVKNQKTGNVPVSLAHLKARNKILVTNNQGKNIATFDDKTLQPIFNQPVEGEPAQIIAGLRDGKAYAGIPDKDIVVVIDGGTGRQIEQIPTGKKPWALRRIDAKVYVANTIDRTISIIDCIMDKVEKTLPAEDFELLRDLDVVSPAGLPD